VVGGNAASAIWGAGTLALAGSDPNYGSVIYTDSRGQLRSQPQALSTSVYPKTNAMLPGTYPIGMTIVQMTGAQATSGGWPGGVSGSVVTFRRSGELDADACASQWFYVTTSVTPKAYYRSGSGTGGANAWSPWVQVVGDDTGWIDVTFDTDWINYGEPAYRRVQYRKIGSQVSIRGLAKSNVARTTGVPIFTLPVGFRPLYAEIFSGVGNLNLVTGAASTGTAHTHTANYGIPLRVDVLATGVVQCSAIAGLNLPAAGYLSLSGISFTTD
jgi:hypothetical protein